MPSHPTASVIIPTRARHGYLTITLETVAGQAERCGAEVLVVTDGPDAAAARIAAAHRARHLELPTPRGANAARNAAVTATDTDLVILVDDDVLAPEGWLEAMLVGARAYPDHEVLGGPVRARLEGGGPRACGREPAPITTLDYGRADSDVHLGWSANMAVRRSALERIGNFDESIFVRGDEEDWQRRYAAGGGRIRYLAAAGIEHRRTPADSTLPRLSRAAYGQGRAARRYDLRKGSAPPLRAELRVLAGCAWHTGRRRCAFGIVMGAHSAGRLREALTERSR